MHQGPSSKNTPARPRRGGRNGTPQKSYASENDIPTYRRVHSDSPATPQKSVFGSAAPLQHSQSTNHKQRSRNPNKNRNKNGTVSPCLNSSQHDPSSDVPAFAGATFHHSPAPSALPIPSFLARTTSAPDSPARRPPAASPSQELSPPTTDSDEASDPSPPPRNEESPLEFFFKADRAEKARTRRASSANAGVPLGPFSPPQDTAQECRTFPRTNGPVQTRRPHITRNPSGISANELDGNPGKPVGPSFSTPYQDRIRAARSNNGSGQATPMTASPATQKVDYDNPSEALKRYLFSGKMNNMQQQQHQNPQQQAPSLQSVQPKLPPDMFPSSVLSDNSNPSVQIHRQSTQNFRPDQISSMEDSLKRMLKLDSN